MVKPAFSFCSAGEQSVAYICSRFYRAPELMLGANEYTTAIDIWSIGKPLAVTPLRSTSLFEARGSLGLQSIAMITVLPLQAVSSANCCWGGPCSLARRASIN